MNYKPKVRFPEFSGEWEKKKLGEVFYNSREKGNELIPIYSVTQKHGLIPRESIDRNIQNDAAPGDNLVVNVDCLTYNMMRMWQGAVGIAKVKCMVSPAYVVLKPSSITNSTFFLYLFERNRSLFLFKSYSHGLTLDRLRLYYDDFASIQFEIPILSEQQKIASFLIVGDEKLQALKKKKSLLDQYKKGVMQKIFSQELRFKDDDGSEFPEWEVKTLGEVCEKQSSNISANKIEENFGDYIIYGAAGELKKVDFYTVENDYISIVKDGAGVGRLLYCKGKSSVLGTLDIIKPYSILNTYFLYCLLSNIDFVKYVSGSTIPHIYFKDYKNEAISIPFLSEQIKIANFLSAIDEKIHLVQGQIEKMEVWKKGLLQKMFV